MMKDIKHLRMCAVFFVLLSSVDILCSEGQGDSITTATNKFTVDLLKVAHKLESKDENFVISTFSVYIALAILQQASRGDTQNELTAVIHAKPSLALEGCKSLIQDLKGPCSTAELQFATKLYLNNVFDVTSDFKDCMEQNFLSEVENINFLDPIAAVQKINLWTSNVTENKIQNIMQRNDLSANTMSVFILAAFFSGQWQQKFKQELTDMTEFTYLDGTSRNISTMHLEKDLSAGHNTEIAATFVRLPFSCYKFALLVILPDEKDGLKGVMDKLEESHLLQMMDHQQYMHVNLSLPKFKFETSIDMIKQLKQLGINAIFNEGADFSGMVGGKFNVGQIKQKVNMEVNEEGSSASAATNAVLYQYSPGQAVRYKEMEIKVDHPFLFSIFDSFNRLHLFSGWVGRPN